KAGQVVTI
nr:Chain C, LYS-ALA-GLY-GLN-VAL-VAL-THR-ILE [synthetic construct]